MASTTIAMASPTSKIRAWSFVRMVRHVSMANAEASSRACPTRIAARAKHVWVAFADRLCSNAARTLLLALQARSAHRMAFVRPARAFRSPRRVMASTTIAMASPTKQHLVRRFAPVALASMAPA